MLLNDLHDAVEALLTESKNALERLKNDDGIWTQPEIEQLHELYDFVKSSFLPIILQNKKNSNHSALEEGIKKFNEYLTWLALPDNIQSRIRFIIQLYEAEIDKSDLLCTAKAYFDIGHTYLTRKENQQDLTKAHHYFQLAYQHYQKLAKQSYFDALYMMGYLNDKGWGTKQNLDIAITWYRKAILSIKNSFCKNLRFPPQCRLANIYIKQNRYKLALEILKEADENNYPEAQFIIGYLYQYGFGVNKDLKKASEYYNKVLASAPTLSPLPEYYIQSKFHYALLCEEEGDYENAAKHYLYLTQHTHFPPAHYQLGRLYEMGLGVKKSMPKATKAYHRAANQGVPRAMVAEAKIYEAIKNYESAAKIYQQAIQLPDNAEALQHLGWLYEEGLGVEKNIRTAIEYYELASGQNYADATFQLARIYEGDKVNYAKNKEKINQLYQLAYKQYLILAEKTEEAAHAYFRLGLMLQYGKGKHINDTLAIDFYQKSRNLGYSTSEPQIKLIQFKQTSDKQKCTSKHLSNAKQNTPAFNLSQDEISQNSIPQCEPKINPITSDQIISQFCNLILQKKFDMALDYIQQKDIEKVFSLNTIDRIKYLWAIADGTNTKYQHDKMNEDSTSLAQHALKAFDNLLQFAYQRLKEIDSNATEYSELQSIINLAELEKYNINPQQKKISDMVVLHEHNPIHSEKTHPVELPSEEKAEIQFKPTIYKQHLVLNHHAIYVLKTLAQAGASHFVHGGMIRDSYLINNFNYQLKPTDTDIITNCTPEQIIQLFPEQSEMIGNRFPLVIIQFDDGEIIQVATFRDHSNTHANKLEFNENGMITKNFAYGNLYTDFNLHDFTINALYCDPDQDEVLDFVNGMDDLTNKIIRFTKDPIESIKEDPLRILRGIRFASQLNFSIEPNAKAAMKSHGHLLSQVHPCRLYLETVKLFQSDCALNAFCLMQSLNLFSLILGANAKYLNKSQIHMLKILFSDNQTRNEEHPATHFDFVMSAVLLGAVKKILPQYDFIPYLAIDRALNELQIVINLPIEVNQSIKTILLIHLLPENTIVTSNKMQLHIYKANLLHEWLAKAKKEVTPTLKNDTLLSQFNLIKDDQKKRAKQVAYTSNQKEIMTPYTCKAV